jgi:hypothetical protein
MTYTAKTATELRQEAGTLAEKIASELTLIDAAIDALGAGTGALTSTHLFVGNGSGVATDVALSGDATLANTGALTIGAGKVTEAMHVAASETGLVVKVAAEDNVIGAIPIIFQVAIAAGALADKTITSTHKIRIIDAYVILRGAGVASTTLQIFGGTAGGTAVTDAMAVSGGDQAVVRAATINDAAYTIAAGDVIKITTATGATQPACLVVITALRVA